MILTYSRIELGVTTNYSKSEKFYMKCLNCDSENVSLTLVEYSKIKIVCNHCGEQEK